MICSGVVLLQLSKSAKDVPDTAVFKGDFDQVRTVAEQEEPESEPKADAIRGTAALIRRFSEARQKKEAAEARRVHEEKLKDQMEPIGENEEVHWDGLRRRKTTLESNGSLNRQKTIHPPLGMAHFPDDDPLWQDDSRPASTDVHGGFQGRFFSSFRRKNSQLSHTNSLNSGPQPDAPQTLSSRPVTTSAALPSNHEDTSYHGSQTDGAMEMDHVFGRPHGLTPPSPGHQGRPIMWSGEAETQQDSRARGLSGSSLAPTPPPHGTKRQFSFQNVFQRHHKHDNPTSPTLPTSPNRPTSRLGLGSRPGSKEKSIKVATEEERLGLVKGDSNAPLPEYSEPTTEDEWEMDGKSRRTLPVAEVTPLGKETSRTPLIRQTFDEEQLEDEKGGNRIAPSGSDSATSEETKWKEWEGRGDGRFGDGGGPPPAFI